MTRRKLPEGREHPSSTETEAQAPSNLRPWETPGAFDKLTKAQQDTLGWIYINRDQGHNPRTLLALLKAGWIVAYEEMAPGDPRGAPIERIPLKVIRYTFPHIAAHMAWCAWCSEQFDEEDAR